MDATRLPDTALLDGRKTCQLPDCDCFLTGGYKYPKRDRLAYMPNVSDRLSEFLEHQAAQGRMYIPVAILGVLGVVFSLQAYAIRLTLNAEQKETFIDAIVLYHVYYFFEPFLMWVIFALILFVLGVIYGGQPFMGYLLRVLPWGMIPMLVGSLLWSYGRYRALLGVSPPELAFSGVGREVNHVNQYLAKVSGDPELVQFMAVGTLFLVVTWYIWTLGVEYANDMSRRRAALSAGFLVVVYAAWKLSGTVL